MRNYIAPTDFRAIRIHGTKDFRVEADGYAFASLDQFADVFVFRSLIADELGVKDGQTVTVRQVLGFLRSIKPAYLAYDRCCFEECAADMETERRAEQALEYFPQHAADTDWEDSMGMS